MTFSTLHKANELTLLEKVSSLLFGEVSAEAWSCWRNVRSFFWGWHWWGFRVRGNTCWGDYLQKQLIVQGGILNAGLFILALSGVVGFFVKFSVNWALQLLGRLAWGISNVSRACRNGGWATGDVKTWGVDVYC